MNTAIQLLAAAGVVAVLIRLARALFAALRGGVDAFLARDLADTRVQRGDITGYADARSVVSEARTRRLRAAGAASMWVGLLAVPPLTSWPALLYASYAILWLLPRRRRPAGSA